MKLVRWTIFTSCLISLHACGRRGTSSDNEPARGKVESAFFAASNDSGVPMRLILALGYVESGLRPDPSSALYINEASQSTTTPIVFGDSAFGLSLNTLGIASDPKANSLETQVKAYGRYLKEQLSKSALPKNAVTAEENLRWIWRLAEIHHGGDQQHRNLWAVFAREMITVLNSGFEIRDVTTGEFIHLEKEATPIKDDLLAENLRQDLALDTYHADIRPAYLFSLTSNVPSSTIVNHPKRIEVIHCPFSLAICIDMHQKNDPGARMAAHYIIPRDEYSSPGILQMARHEESVALTNTSGLLEQVSDRIVVMLVGNSGRYVQGIRAYANPQWMTDYQLRLLGAAVSEICAVLERTEGVNRAACSTPGPTGVTFRNQPAGNYRWGDIADYDESIFTPYVTTGSGSLGTTTIETADGQRVYEAGSQFSLTVKFQAGARRVEIERLIRCGGTEKRVVWEPGGYPAVRNVTSKNFDMTWYDAGPNSNGDQFFRAKVFGDGSKFLGWSIFQVQLKNFQQDAENYLPSKYCSRNGS